MAYRTKRSYRSSRVSRRRRNFRRRWYSSRRYRRRFKGYRRRRGKVEYKRVEFSGGMYFKSEVKTIEDVKYQVIGPYPWTSYCFGPHVANDPSGTLFPLVNIQNGSQISQRIGNKINPVRIRIYGVVSFNSTSENAFLPPLTPQHVYIRFIVYQPRSVDGSKHPYEKYASVFNPCFIPKSSASDSGFIINSGTADDVKQFFPSYEILSRLFACRLPYTEETYSTGIGGQTYTKVTQGLRLDNNQNYNYINLAKTPYRNGIGGSIRILKDKLYRIDTSQTASFPFKFKTKKPSRMVWEESTTQDNKAYNSPKNPVYVLVLPIFPVPYQNGRVDIEVYNQMYFTDS